MGLRPAGGPEASTRRLLILEGMMTAANQVCKQGGSGACWGAASQMPALLHTLVAVFAVKHRLVAIPRANHNKTLALRDTHCDRAMPDHAACMFVAIFRMNE